MPGFHPNIVDDVDVRHLMAQNVTVLKCDCSGEGVKDASDVAEEMSLKISRR